MNMQEIKITEQQLFPAQLWFGPHAHLLEKVIEHLQKILCVHGGCLVCTTCHKITQQQHHSIMWISSEKQYTLDDLSDIFSTIAFALNDNEHFFFIIQKADFLTTACANSLLKSIEEPPAGYHFILLAERQEQILPTIRSRCITQSFYTEHELPPSPLFECFAHIKSTNPIDFMVLLEQSKISERESIELIDSLLAYWIQHYKKCIENKDIQTQNQALTMIDVLKKGYEFPPMPGSSKTFWKNMYLMMCNI
jgi:DNA polymerase III gamma/tau subunit